MRGVVLRAVASARGLDGFVRAPVVLDLRAQSTIASSRGRCGRRRSEAAGALKLIGHRHVEPAARKIRRPRRHLPPVMSCAAQFNLYGIVVVAERTSAVGRQDPGHGPKSCSSSASKAYSGLFDALERRRTWGLPVRPGVVVFEALFEELEAPPRGQPGERQTTPMPRLMGPDQVPPPRLIDIAAQRPRPCTRSVADITAWANSARLCKAGSGSTTTTHLHRRKRVDREMPLSTTLRATPPRRKGVHLHQLGMDGFA